MFLTGNGKGVLKLLLVHARLPGPAFSVDMSQHLSYLRINLQVHEQLLPELLDDVKAFQNK